MSNSVMLICSLAAALFGNILRKYYTAASSGQLRDVFLFNAVCSAVSALILWFWGGMGTVSVYTLLLGCVFGLVTVVQTVTNLRALELGPMSYTSVIISFSTVISAVSGALFWNEKIQAAHLIGILFMLISFVLAVKKEPGEKGFSLQWLVYCLIAFFCTGGIGIMQKIHQSSTHKEELSAFLIVAFVMSFLSSLLLALTSGKKAAATGTSSQWILLGCMLLCGVTVALNNKWNLYLSGVMDSAVFFPLVNGGGLVLTTLAAVLVFRETLTRKQWFGIVFGIASVIFLCNPFS